MDGMNDQLHAKLDAIDDALDAAERTAERALTAARYVFHKVTVHKYAQAALRSEMPVELAWQHYDEAMRNYDGIVALAAKGDDQSLNQAEMAKGSKAIDEAIENVR